MTRKAKQGRKKRSSSLESIGHALDLMLAGHQSVIGPDFILSHNKPDNSDIGHLDPVALRTYDDPFIKSLVTTKADNAISLPSSLKELANSTTKCN